MTSHPRRPPPAPHTETGAKTGRRAARLGIFAAALLACGPALARDSLGVFDDWGAFRDGEAPRCYAIAQPDDDGASGGYATISFWPRARVATQFYAALVRPAAAGSTATLTVGGRRFTLMVRGRGAWAADARADAAIVGAMRTATAMTLAVQDAAGRGYSQTWRLRGAATAIDAAALGCATR
ncbi:MAG: hypothetical protein ACKOUM_00540 [Sphingopyxis sp.]